MHIYDRNREKVPQWFNLELLSFVVHQGMTIDEAFEHFERLAIQENS